MIRSYNNKPFRGYRSPEAIFLIDEYGNWSALSESGNKPQLPDSPGCLSSVIDVHGALVIGQLSPRIGRFFQGNWDYSPINAPALALESPMITP